VIAMATNALAQLNERDAIELARRILRDGTFGRR
jgi:hypothetical protein